MGLSVEAIIGIIAVVVALPPVVLAVLRYRRYRSHNRKYIAHGFELPHSEFRFHASPFNPYAPSSYSYNQDPADLGLIHGFHEELSVTQSFTVRRPLGTKANRPRPYSVTDARGQSGMPT